MKTNQSNSCCGGFTLATQRPSNKVVPRNPPIKGGVRLIYIGDGTIKLKGYHSGSLYYLSNQQRHFTAYRPDVEEILKRRDIILEP